MFAAALLAFSIGHGATGHVRAARATRVVRPAALVVVDPGHGGKDEGASHAGVSEAMINLAVARELTALLRAQGYRVMLTRDEACRSEWVVGAQAHAPGRPRRDCRVNLRDRVLSGVGLHPSVFLSLHCDHYADASVRGPRTYYGEGSDIQRALAVDIQRELDRFRDRPFEAAAAKHFLLLAQPQTPAVTVEMGFLTNPAERQKLGTRAYQREIADAVARGLERYARSHPLRPAPPVDPVEVDRLWQRKHYHHASGGGSRVPRG